MWGVFPDKNKDDIYEAWQYGCVPDKLARLTMMGIKTATASAHSLYLAKKSPVPKAGDYSIILNSKDEAVCIIQTVQVDIVPFNKVDEQHAYQEGEGDRTLAYWREVHKEYFTDELASIQQTFDDTMLVVCEKFKVVYPK